MLCGTLCLALCLISVSSVFGSKTEDAVKMDTILTEGMHLFMTQLLQSVADDCKTCVTEYTAPAIDLFKDVCAICITEYREHGLNLYTKGCQDCIEIYQSYLMVPYAGTYSICRKYYASYNLELFGTGCTKYITAYLDGGLVLPGEACAHCLKLFIAHSLTVYNGSCYAYIAQSTSKQLAQANIPSTHNFKLGEIMYDGILPVRIYKGCLRSIQNYYAPLLLNFYKDNRYAICLGAMYFMSLMIGLGCLHCGVYRSKRSDL